MAGSALRAILPTASSFCPRSFQELTGTGPVPRDFTAEQRTVLAWIDRGVPYRQIERVLKVGRMTVAAIAEKAGRSSRKVRAHAATRKLDGTIARLVGQGLGANQIAASLSMTRQAISRHLIGMGIRFDLDDSIERERRIRDESVGFMVSRRMSVAQIAEQVGISCCGVRSIMQSLGCDTLSYANTCRQSRLALQAPRVLLAAELVPRTWASVLAQVGLNANVFAAYKAHPRDFGKRSAAVAKALGVEEAWLLGEGEPTLRGVSVDELPERRLRVCGRIREAVVRDGRSIAKISKKIGVRASLIGALVRGPRLRPYAYVMPLAMELRCSPGWLSGEV